MDPVKAFPPVTQRTVTMMIRSSPMSTTAAYMRLKVCAYTKGYVGRSGALLSGWEDITKNDTRIRGRQALCVDRQSPHLYDASKGQFRTIQILYQGSDPVISYSA